MNWWCFQLFKNRNPLGSIWILYVRHLECFAAGSKRRSMIPKTQSVMIAMKAVGKAPAKMIDVPSVALVPRMMMSPNPPAPTKAPMAVIPMATTKAFLMPAIMTDTDSGSSTIKRRWLAVIPIPLPTSRIFLSTWIIPVYVFLMIGNSEYKNTVTITTLTPKPKPIIKIEIIAKEGIVWMIFAKRITQLANLRFREIRIPTGIPTIAAKSTP